MTEQQRLINKYNRLANQLKRNDRRTRRGIWKRLGELLREIQRA